MDDVEFGSFPPLKFHNNLEKLEEIKKIKLEEVNKKEYSFFNESSAFNQIYKVKLEIASVIDHIFNAEAIADFNNLCVNDFIYKISTFREKQDKIKYLQKKRKKLWKTFKDEPKEYVLEYLNINTFHTTGNWLEIIADRIKDFDDGELLQSYMKGLKINELPIDEINQEITFLKEHYITKQYILHIDKLLENCQYLEPNKENYLIDLLIDGKVYSNSAKMIFKENGEEIFNYLVRSYPDTKNQAFFNYLFYFMRDEIKKILIEEDESKVYKNYVENLGYFKNYSRMQNVRSSSKKTHNKMMSYFKETYSLKFE